MRQRGPARLLKRLLDIGIAVLVLVPGLPLLALAALAVRVRMGAPVLFTQERAGEGGRPFRIYKLRTMLSTRSPEGQLLPDEVRLTALGRFLRKASLDELPQLLNVLPGDMSLVGPRPPYLRYLPRYTADHGRRHEVMPGISGWAQVHGRNALSWRDKFDHDLWYVEHWTPWLDLWVLGLTCLHVLKPKGIAAADHATMTEFRGPDD